LAKLIDNTRKFQTAETPNVLGIYLLGAVVKDFLKIGIKKIRKLTDEKSEMMYSFFSKQSLRSDDLKPEYYSAFVNLREFQSKTTPVFEIKGGSDRLRKFAADFGLILGAGYNDFKNKHIRLANFPSQSVEDVKKLLMLLKRY
jgi:phosphoserine aminotransferase